MSSTRLVALMVASTAFAVTGCGGSTKPAAQSESSGQTSQGPPLTRAALIAKADAICYPVNVKRSSTKVDSREDYASVIPSLAASEQAAYLQLSKLTPPASMASTWNQIVAGAKTLAEDTTKFGEEATANKLEEAYRLYPAINQIQVKMISAAQRGGFKDCAQQ